MHSAATLSSVFCVIVTALAAPYGPPGHAHDSAGQVWSLANFKSLVAFGDSYTDDSRLGYFSTHNGSAPPVGWVDPANYNSASGGRPWPQYVAQYAGVEVYNYAVSGAVCSNDITPRTYQTIHAPFPAVEQYEVPAYIADSKYVEPNGAKFLDEAPDKTVYSMWIGTNDLGNNAFLTDSQVAGKTLVDYTECVFTQLERIYQNGARYFVLQNLAPLQLSPLYGLPGRGGVSASQYWPNKPANITEVSYKMLEYTQACNAIYAYQTPFLLEVARRYPGAHFAIMNMNGLLTDIYNNPGNYLNGTAPLNVTGFTRHCSNDGTNCVTAASPDSFMWFDELHPSEQVDRVIAREFIGVVKGNSRWATYWSG